MDNVESFNCLFCYCPLYILDERCEGAFTIAPNGVKDCGNCSLPHEKENYGYIVEKSSEISVMMRETRARRKLK
jgi:Zn-finger protein